MGRRLSEYKGATPEANKLAEWLRQVTHGIGVKQLKQDFASVNKNYWTTYRNGSDLIPESLLPLVVEKYVKAGERDIHLRLGRRLLADAKKAQRAKEQAPAAPTAALARAKPGETAAAVDALLRLTTSQEQLIEAERKLRASELRESYLQELVTELQRKQAHTEAERDRAQAEAREALERELKLLREYRSEADSQLERAQQSQRSALELRLAVEEKVVHDQAAVQDTIPSASEESARAPATAPDVTTELPRLEQFGEALQLTDAGITQGDRELADLREEIGLSPAPDPKVIHGQLADDTENAATSDNASSASADGEPAHFSSLDDDLSPTGSKLADMLIWACLLAVTLTPLMLHEDSKIGLVQTGGTKAAKEDNSSRPSYSFKRINSPEGGQARFKPASKPGVLATEHSFSTVLRLSARPDPVCATKAVVPWKLKVNGTDVIASGSLNEEDRADTIKVEDLPSGIETITLTSDQSCEHVLKLEAPTLHSKTWF